MLKDYQIAWLCFIGSGLFLVAIFAALDCIGLAIFIGLLAIVYVDVSWFDVWGEGHAVVKGNPFDQKSLETLVNQIPGDNANLYFYPRCHANARLEIFYTKQSGILSASCEECREVIFEFKIEKEE